MALSGAMCKLTRAIATKSGALPSPYTQCTAMRYGYFIVVFAPELEGDPDVEFDRYELQCDSIEIDLCLASFPSQPNTL